MFLDRHYMSFVPLHKDLYRNVTEVLGLAWGDEGKGKVLCYLSQWNDLIIRSTGGNNAGHTVVYNGVKFPLHLVPTGIVRGNAVCIMAPGMFIDLKVLWKEIEFLRKNGVNVTPDNLKISDRAVVVLPYDIVKDAWEEKKKGNSSIGTTKRGMGPSAENKVKRVAVRMIDIKQGTYINRINDIFMFCPEEILIDYPTLKAECIEYCKQYSEKLSPFICNTQPIVNKACRDKKRILFEGAQSYYLSMTNGYYPYTTVTDPDASGTLSSGCVGPLHAEYVIGVFKAYTSRVGSGPFPTELFNWKGPIIRALGNEYGTTTGRPRRVGWLDLVQIKNAAEANGVNCLAINHLDTIGKIGLKVPFIEVCTAYCNKNDLSVPLDDGVPTDYENIVPYAFEKFEGWEVPKECKSYEQLPSEAQRFISFIEDYVGVPIAFIGIGPKDEDMISRGFNQLLPIDVNE